MDATARHATRRRAARALACVILPLATGGCAWLGLAWGALTYPTTQSGESANVVVNGDFAYLTRGSAGLEILRLGAAASSERLPLPPGVDSADDLAVADGLLFVLDARPPGHLGVFSLADPAAPKLVGLPVAVDVGPFSGVAAAAGRVVVSGGTSKLTLRAYDGAGRLGEDVASADLGRGQPDVLLDARGEFGFVSTHDWGPHFRLTVMRTALGPASVAALGSVPLETYGFTPGGAKPANFPVETAAAGSIVFVACASGLGIVDVGDTAAPKLLAVLDPGVQPVNVDVRDGVAALVGSSPRPMLVLADVRDPSHPKILQSLPLPEGSRATGVALTPSRVVVAAHGRGTLLFDRSKGTWEHVAHQPPKLFPKESQS
jgi:hypothetical protein